PAEPGRVDALRRTSADVARRAPTGHPFAPADRDRRYRRGIHLFARREGTAAEAPDRRNQRRAEDHRRLRRSRQRPLPLLHHPVKPERPLRAAGIAASHSDALLRQRAEPTDLLPEFERFGGRLARQLGAVLTAFGGGKAPEAGLVRVERKSGAELAKAIGSLAANCLMAIGASNTRLLFSIDGAALLAQLDRAFGGTGEIGDDLPAALPLSADLMAQRVEQSVAELLSKQIDPSEPVTVVERDSSYATLAPFRK